MIATLKFRQAEGLKTVILLTTRGFRDREIVLGLIALRYDLMRLQPCRRVSDVKVRREDGYLHLVSALLYRWLRHVCCEKGHGLAFPIIIILRAQYLPLLLRTAPRFPMRARGFCSRVVFMS